VNQIFLGAWGPFMLAALLYLLRGCRAGLVLLIVTPLLMTAGALWAVVPDLPRLFGLQALYLRLSMDPRTDFFLWHHAIDQIETDSRWYAAGIVLMAAALLAAAVREVRRAEAEA
jgi:hypothetical protein